MTGQRIAITGSSGLIGGALSAFLRERGDTVIRLVRRPVVPPLEARLPRPGDDVDELTAVLSTVDAVVHLAGSGIGDRRWNERVKDELWASRVETTTLLAQALRGVPRPVRFVSGSATGFYGDRGDEVLDERSSRGAGFLADLVQAWEHEAQGAASFGHAVACARTGLVVSSRGGAFPRMARATRLGAGGALGSGRQWWSWISLRDEIRALAFLIDDDAITGPVNLVAPRASRQEELAQAMARSMRRPALVSAPSLALRVVLGEMSSQVLASTRVRPSVLAEHGFSWMDANQDQMFDRLVHDLTRGSRS